MYLKKSHLKLFEIHVPCEENDTFPSRPGSNFTSMTHKDMIGGCAFCPLPVNVVKLIDMFHEIRHVRGGSQLEYTVAALLSHPSASGA